MTCQSFYKYRSRYSISSSCIIFFYRCHQTCDPGILKYFAALQVVTYQYTSIIIIIKTEVYISFLLHKSPLKRITILYVLIIYTNMIYTDYVDCRDLFNIIIFNILLIIYILIECPTNNHVIIIVATNFKNERTDTKMLYTFNRSTWCKL